MAAAAAGVAVGGHRLGQPHSIGRLLAEEAPHRRPRVVAVDRQQGSDVGKKLFQQTCSEPARRGNVSRSATLATAKKPAHRNTGDMNKSANSTSTSADCCFCCFGSRPLLLLLLLLFLLLLPLLLLLLYSQTQTQNYKRTHIYTRATILAWP